MTSNASTKFDFAAAKAAVKQKAQETVLAPTELDRVRFLIENHLTELTNWEEGWIYSQKEWLTRRAGNYLTDKCAKILKELEDKLGVQHG
jgi:hypothetical protein